MRNSFVVPPGNLYAPREATNASMRVASLPKAPVLRLRLAIPVREAPEGAIPRGMVGALDRDRARVRGRATSDGQHRAALHEQLVHTDEQRRPPHRIDLRPRGGKEIVVRAASPPRRVVALVVVLLRGNFLRREEAHEAFWIRRRLEVGEELEVGAEMRVGVAVRRVGAAEHGRRDRLQLHFDPRLARGLLHDRLDLLCGRIDRGLEHELQLDAVPLPDPVRPATPAAGLEDLIRLVDIELPRRRLTSVGRRRVQPARRRTTRPAEDLLLNGAAIDQQAQRGHHRRIEKERMLRLDAGPLPVYFSPRVGLVDLDVHDVAPEREVELPLADRFQSHEDVVVDARHVRRIVVGAGLEHGARSGHRVTAALHLDGLEERPVRNVIARIDLGPYEVAGFEVEASIRSSPDRPQVRRRLAPRYGSNTWRGMIMPTPQRPAVQYGVGALKVS